MRDLRGSAVLSSEQIRLELSRAWSKERKFDHAMAEFWKEVGVVLGTFEPSTALILCGLPGSGKSTWVEEHGPDLGRVIVEVTALAKHQRDQLRSLFQGAEWHVICVFINTPYLECLARNRVRSDERTCLPDERMWELKNGFEPPTEEEGFDGFLEVACD